MIKYSVTEAYGPANEVHKSDAGSFDHFNTIVGKQFSASVVGILLVLLEPSSHPS